MDLAEVTIDLETATVEVAGTNTGVAVISADAPAVTLGIPGPQGATGPPTFPYVQPDAPAGVPNGTLWVDTDEEVDIDTAVTSHDVTITGDQDDPGWWAHLHINYTPATGAPESFFVESSASGSKQRVFWLNENGVPRCASARSTETPLKVHGFANGQSASAMIFEVWDKWTSGRKVLWAINKDGRPVLGRTDTNGEILGTNVITLGPTDPVPTGLRAGTVIVRTT